jgi:hypothetical protein
MPDLDELLQAQRSTCAARRNDQLHWPLSVAGA